MTDKYWRLMGRRGYIEGIEGKIGAVDCRATSNIDDGISRGISCPVSKMQATEHQGRRCFGGTATISLENLKTNVYLVEVDVLDRDVTDVSSSSASSHWRGPNYLPSPCFEINPITHIRLYIGRETDHPEVFHKNIFNVVTQIEVLTQRPKCDSVSTITSDVSHK